MHEPERRAADDALLALVLELRAARARGRARPPAARGSARAPPRAPSRSAQAFSARPSTPIVSGCRVQSSGVAIERYWWIRAKAIGCEKVSLPVRRARLERRLAVGDPVRVAGEHVRSCVVVEPGDERGAQRDQERRRLLAVRVVGGVEHLLGRDEAVEVEQVDRAPDRGVEEDAGLAGEVAASAARSAMPAWAMISCAPG